jgi:hypothetical protein
MQSNIFNLGAELRPGASQRHLLQGLKATVKAALSRDAVGTAVWAIDHAVLAAHFVLEAGGSFNDALSRGYKVRADLQAIHDRRTTALLEMVSARARDLGLHQRLDGAYHQVLVRARRASDSGASIGDVMAASLPNEYLTHNPERRK